MAMWPSKSDKPGTMTEMIKIPMTNLGFSTTASSNEVSVADCDIE